jgi:hypothetical protein
MPNALQVENAPNDCALRAQLQSTSGGSSDTEENEFTVRPRGAPDLAHRVVATATPVGQRPRARRKARASMASTTRSSSELTADDRSRS